MPKPETPPMRVNGPVPPNRRRNPDVRPREHLTPTEVELLMKTARKRGRYGHRDATMILIAYRHMLRVGELVALRWDLFDFKEATLQVRRLKGGKDGVHPLGGSELRALRVLKRQQDPVSPYCFTTERHSPMTAAGFRTMLARIGKAAGFPWRVHPHMLRHACGYKLGNEDQNPIAIKDYAGHRRIETTMRYIELASGRYRDFWAD